MQNLIDNVKGGSHSIINNKTFYDLELAKELARINEEKTKNKTIVQRVLDYTDSFNNEPRHHYSFDIIEIIK